MSTEEAKIIIDSIPEDSKEKGLQKLSTFFLKKGGEIKTQIEPKLQEIKSQLESPGEGVCLSENQLNTVINLRNNIVDKLNSISNVLNYITVTLGISSSLFGLIINSIAALRVTKIALNQSIKSSPVPPGPLVSFVIDTSDAIDAVTFDNLGQSKLSPKKKELDSFSMPLALVSGYISTAITLLNLVDDLIKQCQPDADLNETDNNLIQIANSLQQQEQQVDSQLYKGFILEIETEDPPQYSELPRKRAIAKNRQGITLLNTEYSFTTNDNILINELKLIIDRDNLSSY